MLWIALGLAYPLFVSRGHTSPWILVITACFGMFFVLWRWPLILPRLQSSTELPGFKLKLAAFFLVLMTCRPNVIYADKSGPFWWATLALLATALGVTLWAIWDPKKDLPKVVGVSALVFYMLCVPVLSPDPFIDVFRSNTIAAKALLTGQNPYTAFYPNIYDGAWGYHPGFLYWPGLLIPIAAGQYFFQDIRYGQWFVFFLGALAFLAGLKISRSQKLEWAMLGLALPVMPFMIEQAWSDLAAVGFLLGAVALFMRGNKGWAWFVLGIATSTKQTMVVMACFWLLIPFLQAWVGVVNAKINFLKAVGAFLLGWVPPLMTFYLLNPEAFMAHTFYNHVHTPSRFDALNIPSWIFHKFKISIEWGVPAAVISLGLSLYLLSKIWEGKAEMSRRFRAGLPLWQIMMVSAFFYLGTFLFGKFAFCNYYFFVYVVLLSGLALKAQAAPSDSRITE